MDKFNAVSIILVLNAALLIFTFGFFIRSASYFSMQKKQKDELIAVFKEIRNSLQKVALEVADDGESGGILGRESGDTD